MGAVVEDVVVDLRQQAADRYRRVNFDVPAGTDSIGVQVDFDHDLGIIDLGCESPNGWRGWSGGARTEFTITSEAATPGYIPGNLEPGTWSVILGLHLIPNGPVPVQVRITMPSEVRVPEVPSAPPPPQVRRGSSRNLPAPAGFKWYAGDPHNHTYHSDGTLSIEELAALGADMGLDYLGVTDHNTVSHHPHLPEVSRQYGITLIPGQEVTTHRGHANAYGDIGWIDFREPVDEWVRQTRDRGGLFSINHAIDGDCAWVSPLEETPGALELWHSSWYENIYAAGIFAWLSGRDRSGTVLGGSDFHRLEGAQRPGIPTTWVLAKECTPEALLEAMIDGRTTITGAVREVPGGYVPELFDCPILLRQSEDTILAIDAGGLVFTSFLGERKIVEGAYEYLEAPRQDGPYSLLRPDRQIVALSP